jgi:H+/Cl- antiporter ClcA
MIKNKFAEANRIFSNTHLVIGLLASKYLISPAISNLYLTCITDYDMESNTALMFVVVGASMGLFGMVLLVMIKTFQEIKSKTAQY